MGLCDVCCAVGYLVLLFLVQRHTSVFVQFRKETCIVDAYFCARQEIVLLQQNWVLRLKVIRMDNDHTERRTRVEPFDIIKSHVTLARVPGFEWVVLREDCLAQRTPFGPVSNCCLERVELQVKRQLVCARAVWSKSTVHPKNVKSCPSSPPLPRASSKSSW